MSDCWFLRWNSAPWHWLVSNNDAALLPVPPLFHSLFGALFFGALAVSQGDFVVYLFCLNPYAHHLKIT
jgi:hypothetical protein